MFVLDILVRGFFIPFIWLFILSTVPEFSKNMRDWGLLFNDRKQNRTVKRKTIKVKPRAMDNYSNSFSKYLHYSDDFIITYK